MISGRGEKEGARRAHRDYRPEGDATGGETPPLRSQDQGRLGSNMVRDASLASLRQPRHWALCQTSDKAGLSAISRSGAAPLIPVMPLWLRRST